MKPCFLISTLLALSVTLAACGGGGGDSGTQPASVSSVMVGAPMYGQPLLFTINGSQLAGGIDLSSAGCRDFTLGTAAPHISSASVAYYRCTVMAVGAQQASVMRRSDNTVLATVEYTVPVPQVTLNVSNGASAGSGPVNGSLVITLAPQQAPITVDNFLAYVNGGFYDGTVFHRNAPGFVLQGGGWAAALNPALPVPAPKATQAPIALEVGRGLSNLRLSVAMARTGVLNSATSQFFINLADNAFLDTSGGGYAVFGNVTAGAAVVDAMAAATCAPYPALLGAGECLPVPNVVVWAARQTR
ncbi:MAG: peptidylprolyl isomerase [Rubrivivax sp.]|nr:peptidylprolyl isomerase [Rubrivivax sp.]